MGLNKSKGNMYEFITHTWNTVKGKCQHDCSYCYMKRFKNQREIRFDEKELKTDLGKGNFIFVGSSNDLFAEEIPAEWIVKTLEHCNKFDNQYFLQTKNPKRLIEFIDFSSNNFRFCTTIETNRYIPEIMVNCPHPCLRNSSLLPLIGLNYITIEPIMDFDLEPMVKLIERCYPIQVNIGADSCGHHLPEPDGEKLKALISELEKFTKVHLKKNLNRLLKN